MNESVFISYNHADIEQAKAVETFLEKHEVLVIRDEKDMLVGRGIEQFIEENIRGNQFVLFLISSNSLSSDWVSMEIVEALWASKFQEGKLLIPCCLDDAFLDNDLIVEMVALLDKELKANQKERTRLVRQKMGTIHLDEKIKRLVHRRNNLPKVFAHLQTHKTVNIAPPNFEQGMAEVLKAIGKSGSAEFLTAYAKWLVRRHSSIPVAGLQGTTEIELNKVFVSLRGELSKSWEVKHAQNRFLKSVETIERDLSLSPLEKQRQKSRKLGRSAIMPSIEERDAVGKSGLGLLNLAEAFVRFDRLIILGDPGMGKTTLARWLVLKFAEALVVGKASVSVSADQISGKRGSEESFDLGPVRLPILIRVGEMAPKLPQEARHEDVMAFLGEQTWLGRRPAHDEAGQNPMDAAALRRLMLNHISKGQALVIFDGLDEVSDESERRNTVNAILSFLTEIEKNIPSTHAGPRNKFIVTSRIAGYHACPLQYDDLFHVTIQPMEDPAIVDFCHTWVSAAHHKAAPQGKKLEIEFASQEIARGLIEAIFDKTRSGVRILAGTPLHLTELGKIYHKDQKLPDTRANLYEAMARNMLEPWRNRSPVTADEYDLFREKVFFVLADIAEWIHEEYPSGLIGSDEMAELVGESLVSFYRENPHVAPKTSLSIEKERFLKTLNEDVGILAARGAEHYGFLHLTFEEFFAAKKLLRYPERAAQSILDKAYRPRWREPLLLALGQMRKSHSESTRQEVLRRLLEMPDPMGSLVPRSASLIAQSLPEMGFKPDSELMRTIILQLLGAYAGAGEFKDGEVLRASIDESVKPLLTIGFLRISLEQTLATVLENEKYPLDLKNSAALMLLRNDLGTEPLARALLSARPHDSAVWKWPVHVALVQNGRLQPEWLDVRSLLPFRVYLKEHPEAKVIIEQTPDWLQVIVLLYGGMVISGDTSNISYEFSQAGIFMDSCLTEPIIQLIESGKSPESLSSYCELAWRDERLALTDRTDCLLCLSVLQKSLPPEASALASEAGHPLREAVVARLDLVGTLLNPTIGAMINKANPALGSILPAIEKESDARQLMFRMIHLPLSFRGTMIGDPLSWLHSVPEDLQPTLLAEYWVRGLFADDAAYSFAVILDTAGRRIEKLGPEVIARSFALANQVTNLPPFEKWRLERAPFEPKDLDDILDVALLHLAALSSEFNMLKYWALDQIAPLLKPRPQLLGRLLFLLKQMERSTYFLDSARLLFDGSEANTPMSDEDMERNVESDFSKAPLYLLAVPGNKRLHLKILDAHRQLDKAHLALRVLSNYHTSGFYFARGNREVEEAALWALFDHANRLVAKLHSPEAQIRGYLKLASFCEQPQSSGSASGLQSDWSGAFSPRKRDRRLLVGAAVNAAGKIKDQYALAQCLREIQTWAEEDLALQKQLANLRDRLTDVKARAVFEDRYSPAFFTFPETIAPEHRMPFALTVLGAFLRDMNLAFGLPSTPEGLWEQLQARPMQQNETVVKKLCELGIAVPLRLTLPATLGLNRLIRQGRFDLLFRLMTCVGSPTPEAVPVISEWLDIKNPPLQAFASLLLIEAGILTTKTFPHLESVIFRNVMGRQDQFRNRINQALNPSERPFFASKLGIECLEMVEVAQETYEDTKPYLVRALSWIDEYLVYDDPDIIRHFVQMVKTPGRRADTACHSLRGIHLLTDQSFVAYIDGLRDTHPQVRTSLLRSVIFVLHHNSLHFDLQNKPLQGLRTEIEKAVLDDDLVIRKYALDAIGYLPAFSQEEWQMLMEQTTKGESRARALALIALGRAAFEQSKPLIESFLKHKLPELRRAAAECLCRELVPAAGLLQPTDSKVRLDRIQADLQLPPEEILYALLDAARHHWWDDYSKNCTILLGTFFEQHPRLFEAFVPEALTHCRTHRGVRGLHDYEKHTEWQTQMVYLDALAAGAAKLPETFRNAIEQSPGWEIIFRQLVLQSGTFTDRRNALICISCLRNMNEDASIAFCTAMKDIAEVQATAVKSIWRFEETEPQFIRAISEMMDTESLGACHAMVGMLQSIGTHPKTGTTIRQHILEILKSKLEMEAFREPVYLLEKQINRFKKSDGTEQETEEGGNIVRHLGRLDHQIYRAILDVAGIRTKKEI